MALFVDSSSRWAQRLPAGWLVQKYGIDRIVGGRRRTNEPRQNRIPKGQRINPSRL